MLAQYKGNDMLSRLSQDKQTTVKRILSTIFKDSNANIDMNDFHISSLKEILQRA